MVAAALNVTDHAGGDDDPATAAWRLVRREVLEPLLPAARLPLEPGRNYTLLSRRQSPDEPTNEYEAVLGFKRLSSESTLRLGAEVHEDRNGRSFIRLQLDPGSGRQPGPRALANALGAVWLAVLHKEGWTRLKRCRTCQEWFVDQTLNRAGVFCTLKSCSNRFWNRPHRREAHRRRLREGRRRRGGPRPKVTSGAPRSIPR